MHTTTELYQLVTSLSGLGIWERNLSTGAFYWNSIMQEMLEVTPDFGPDPENSLSFYKQPEFIRDLLDQVVVTGRPQVAEVEMITAKGTLKWVKIRISARVNDRVDKLVYGTLEDVTKDVRLRQEFQERQQRFLQAFDHAPIGMALVSLKGEWIKVNKSLHDLLGYSEIEFTTHTFQDFTHPDDLSSDLEQMHALLRGQIPHYGMEKRYFHKAGHVIWALLSVSVVRSEDQAALYFISQIKDISESKRNAEIIRSQNARLLNFAHIVSHNLRSHAGNIRMLTNIIVEEQDVEERNNWIAMLNDNADSLLNTLSELNEVVQIHDNGPLHRTPVNLRKELQEVTNILYASIKAADLNVEMDVSDQLVFSFNPSYLESILINLITNSIKYKHPDRQPSLQIHASQTFEKTILKFTDNGLGIDMKLNGHKLFGMYKTFHGNEDARGMGLFLVKNQVEAMGGRISAQSELGTGTTFLIELARI
jgi:PAS domain S-box-containing protein